ncbi:hypothetical protein [Taibaiella koreensis]|uniref:hypothetical protein n=1 Tax=Taibaiella koreensis TaxID=1268548 RepID=UPI000E5A0AFA|nr:hypothetical protein [Taibaiella koreensis]
MKALIHQFFDDYTRRFNDALNTETPDIEGMAACFASCFVEAGLAGIHCSRNNTQLRDMLPKGFAFYRSIGAVSMKIGSRVITPLDKCHAMVRIHWQSLYRKQEGNRLEIGFDAHYFVQVIDGTVKIFACVTGDEQKQLQEKGLTPYS